MSEIRQKIVNEAYSWIGTPYHHRARVKGGGVDCAQLLAAVYGDCGLIADTVDENYPMDWHLHRDEERYLKRVKRHAHKVTEPLPGDIALFKFGRVISHGAIITEWPFIIHAYRPEHSCCMSDVSKSAELTDRLVGFYRLDQLEEEA